jgi:hypothetical protein
MSFVLMSQSIGGIRRDLRELESARRKVVWIVDGATRLLIASWRCTSTVSRARGRGTRGGRTFPSLRSSSLPNDIRLHRRWTSFAMKFEIEATRIAERSSIIILAP